MTSSPTKTSLRSAALIAGIGLLIMVIAAPFAELFVYPKLVVSGNAAETTKNILANKTLFVSGIMGYLITFVSDVVNVYFACVSVPPPQYKAKHESSRIF